MIKTRSIIIIKAIFITLFTFAFFLPYTSAKNNSIEVSFFLNDSLYTDLIELTCLKERIISILLCFTIEIVLLISFFTRKIKQQIFLHLIISIMMVIFFICITITMLQSINAYHLTNKLMDGLFYSPFPSIAYYIYIVLTIVSFTYLLLSLIKFIKERRSTSTATTFKDS